MRTTLITLNSIVSTSIVTTSKALVTRSDALVPNSLLFLPENGWDVLVRNS